MAIHTDGHRDWLQVMGRRRRAVGHVAVAGRAFYFSERDVALVGVIDVVGYAPDPVPADLFFFDGLVPNFYLPSIFHRRCVVAIQADGDSWQTGVGPGLNALVAGDATKVLVQKVIERERLKSGKRKPDDTDSECRKSHQCRPYRPGRDAFY